MLQREDGWSVENPSRTRKRGGLARLAALLCATAALGTASSSALAASVAVFDDPGYVDTSNDKDAESDSVQAALRAQGHTVTTFHYVDDSSFAHALDEADVLVIPELESGYLAGDLSFAAMRSISSFVAAGGGVVIHGSYSSHPLQATLVLDRVFGFTLSAEMPGPGSYALQPAAAATMFAHGPASLPTVDGLVAITAGLPADAKVIYGSESQAMVAMLPFGTGDIIYLGWDWFHGPPLGEQNGGWEQVLRAAVMELSSAAVTPPAPGVCGNGVVEGAESCDDGSANGLSGSCCTSSCIAKAASARCSDDGDTCTTDMCDGAGACVHSLVDRDADGVCDASDACVNPDDTHDFSTETAHVMLRNLLNPSSKLSTLTLDAEFALSPDTSFGSFQPMSDGVRVLVTSRGGSKVHVDQALPGGAFAGAGSRGWKGYPSGAVWSYLDRTGAALGGIKRVLIQKRGRPGNESVRVEVVASGVGFPADSDDSPLEAVVVLGDQSAATAGACGESTFESRDCSFNARASRLTCAR